MGRRLNVSTPTVINTELVPLDESFYIEKSGQTEQWFYDNTNQYKPNRKITPLILTPKISVFDKDTSTSYTPSFYIVRWFEKSYNETSETYVETEITNITDSSSADYVKVGNNLRVKKNVSYSHAVTIRCEATYIDPRDSGVTYLTGDSITLSTNRDATSISPILDVECPPSQAFNPLTDYDESQPTSSRFTMKAKGDWSGDSSTGEIAYDVDPAGMEEIIPDNSDDVVTCAPSLDIRYGDTIQTDQKFMRRQTSGGNVSPIEGNAAYIQKIQGNGTQFNQLQPLLSLSSPNVDISLNGNIYSVQRTEEGIGNQFSFPLPIPINGHVIYYCYQIWSNDSFKANTAIKLNNISLRVSSQRITKGLTRCTDTNQSSWRFLNNPSESDIGKTIYIDRRIIFIDLSLIFGLGNEPTTVDEVEAWLAQNIGSQGYYPYNEGTLVPMRMVGIKTTGFNQWDGKKRAGGYDTETGEFVEAEIGRIPLYMANENPIKVIPDTEYYFKGSFTVTMYDAGMNYLGYTAVVDGTYTIPHECHYINITVANSQAVSSFCINISDPSRNGTYEEYKENTKNLDVTKIYGKLNGAGNMVQVFPDGMRGVGTASDILTIDETTGKWVAGIRTSVLDLGNTDVGVETSYQNKFSFLLPNNATKINNSTDIISLKCNVYAVNSLPVAGGTTLSDLSLNRRYRTSGSLQVYLQDSRHSTAPSSQDNWLAGVECWYELATPLTYTDLIYSSDGGQTGVPLNRILDYEWYGIKNNQEVKVDTLPWYVEGQNTDTLKVDAMYGEEISVVLRAKKNGSNGELYPAKAYRSITWRIPDIDTHVLSENGGAVRSNTISMKFGTVINVLGNVLSEAKKMAHLRFNWKTRKSNESIEHDKEWGQEKEVAATDLVNYRNTPSVSNPASTIVFPYVYLLGAYEEVTDNGQVVTDNGETVYDRTL